jgi:hypothetical protein
MNADTPALNESEENARQKLVALCRAMLAGELSFFEGAIQVCSLRFSIRVPEDDPDLTAFVIIGSETDHLPPRHAQPFWSSYSLQRLQPEFEKTEAWARSFAVEACKNLIGRFARP